ncbi:restriction endonuclease subunit S [Pelistega ratti]|uniref:restriction endonuclease subunit S n=1 Tax=Pelistega ratti TaxID=2652177 RepID=UPI00135B3C53|nr:restriction endonuclease subunit S [Pelistega ratti]
MKNDRTFLEKLLDGAKVEWKELGDVVEMKRGQSITAKNVKDGNIPVISGGQKPAYYHNESNRKGRTITVAGSGAYAGFIMFWDKPIFVGDAFSIKSEDSILDLKYVYYFLLQNQQKIYGLKKGSGVPHVYPKDLAKLIIPIPPLEIQQKIVKVLDKFTELEAELALRTKQYEYYRNQLLTFDNISDRGGTRLIQSSKPCKSTVLRWFLRLWERLQKFREGRLLDLFHNILQKI